MIETQRLVSGTSVMGGSMFRLAYSLTGTYIRIYECIMGLMRVFTGGMLRRFFCVRLGDIKPIVRACGVETIQFD